MTPDRIRTIRKEAGLSQTGLAALLRIKDIRTVRRWEKGVIPITGPASIVMELLEAGELPSQYFNSVGSKVPHQSQWTSAQIARVNAESAPPKPINRLDPKIMAIVSEYRTKADSDGNDGV